MILNKKWDKVNLEKTKDTGIIYLDSKVLTLRLSSAIIRTKQEQISI